MRLTIKERKSFDGVTNHRANDRPRSYRYEMFTIESEDTRRRDPRRDPRIVQFRGSFETEGVRSMSPIYVEQAPFARFS